MPVNINDLRRYNRTGLRCDVALDWRAEDGITREQHAVTVDLSQGGMAVDTPQLIALDSKLIVRSDALKLAYLSTVRYCRWNQDRYRLGLEFVAKTASVSQAAPNEGNLYEMLRLNPESDRESIDRVYRTLARRYHPDNQETGDPEAFLCLHEAYQILSDPARRQSYDAAWQDVRKRPVPLLNKRELFTGIAGEQNRRFAILCLLYRERMTDFQSLGFTLLDLDRITGCTNEETGFSVWYLLERGLVKRSNDSFFAITADGIDHVERNREQFADPVRLIEAGIKPRAFL